MSSLRALRAKLHFIFKINVFLKYSDLFRLGYCISFNLGTTRYTREGTDKCLLCKCADAYQILSKTGLKDRYIQ